MIDIKELSALIKLCRTQGVTSIKMEGIELILGDPPQKQVRAPRKRIAQSPVLSPGGITDETRILTDELSTEQMLMWSSAPGGIETGPGQQ